MNKYSLIYRNIYIYRTIMIILYSGKYLNRFKSVTDVLSEKQCGSVTELCFGDIYLAQWCKNNGVRWTGIDVNEQFVSFAIKQGYDAKCLDLLDFPDLQKSSVIVMMGSLPLALCLVQTFVLCYVGGCNGRLCVVYIFPCSSR